MRALAISLALLATGVAYAAPVNLPLDDAEQQAYVQVLDALTQSGPQAGATARARLTVYFLNKLGAAQREAAKPQAAPVPPPDPPQHNPEP
jgi:hypothetical protein